MSQDLHLGSLVEVPAGRGIVRFFGPTEFSPAGKWVGIELIDAVGKNDGSLQGVVYFTCRPNRGVFVRPSQVKVVPPEAEPQVPRTPGRPTHGRTPSMGNGAISRANSLRSVPGSVASRASSPAKPTPSSSLAPRAVARAVPASPTKRPSLNGQSRLSSPGDPGPSSPRIASPATTLPPTPRMLKSPPPTLPVSPLVPTTVVTRPAPDLPPPSATLAPPSPGHRSSSSTDEDKELRAKIRVLEAKRADDARHVRELETRLSEAEAFVALRPKLQAKLASQQTDLIATRRELADAQQLADQSENKLLDGQEQLEMAMLDKEVAEERAEIAEAELEELKERIAVAEVEMEVLKNGGGTGGEGGDESSGKDSLAYIQLEKHNERLKEALMKLRDMSQETEHEQRHRITEMEKDLVGIDDIQSQYDTALSKLANAEVQIEDLKLQLDDALGAEEMLVQLTERTLNLGEIIEEKRITIEDLESLQELNEELIENHIETEKAMQEDIDARDVTIREHKLEIENLEDDRRDLQATIGQFRDLVLQLQGELDALRAQTQTAQNESASAVSQTAAVMSMNLKLQSSASKNQAKNVEFELTRIDARETKELLSIVQPYLPQLYVETDSDATSCYLYFQRLAAKTDLINTTVAQIHGMPESVGGAVIHDSLVGACELRGRLSSLAVLSKRFATIMSRCDVETFLNIGKLYQEIAPMEKRLDLHVELLRRDEFRDMECAGEVSKILSQFEHLAETYFSDFETDVGERALGLTLSLGNDLDMFTAAIGLARTSINSVVKDKDAVLDMGDLDIDSALLDPLDSVLEQCKTARGLARKLSKRVEDLVHDSAALRGYLLPQLKALTDIVSEPLYYGVGLAQQVMPYISDVRSSKTTFQLSKITAMAQEAAANTVGKNLKSSVSAWEATGSLIALFIQEGGRLLPLTLEAENVFKITGTAPWVTRVAEIKATLAVNVEAERKVAQLNDEMQGLVRSLKTKDQGIQESIVKIELMERRMEAAKKQGDVIVDLEGELNKARKQERAYEEAIEQLQTDIDTLEQEVAKLKTMPVGPERQAVGVSQPETESVPIEGSLETSHLLEQIDAYRGTVRFLRNENSYLKGHDLLKDIESLPALPETPVTRPATPPLDPSGSDSEDSDSDFPRPPLTLRSLATEQKLLYRDVLHFSSSPRVVDLSAMNAKRAEAGRAGKMWMSKKELPANHLLERKMEAERLGRRVRGLVDRASAIGRL